MTMKPQPVNSSDPVFWLLFAPPDPLTRCWRVGRGKQLPYPPGRGATGIRSEFAVGSHSTIRAAVRVAWGEGGPAQELVSAAPPIRSAALRPHRGLGYKEL